MSFFGKGHLLANEVLRAATTPSPGPRPPILGGEGTRFGSSECMCERGLIQSKRPPDVLELTESKRHPPSPRLRGAGPGVRGCRELSKVECRGVVFWKRAAFADGLLRATTTPSPGPHPPILGGEGTRFGSSQCIRERGQIQSKRPPDVLQLTEFKRRSPSPRLRGAGPGVRGCRELSKVECRDVVFWKRAAFCERDPACCAPLTWASSPHSWGRGNALWKL